MKKIYSKVNRNEKEWGESKKERESMKWVKWNY